MKTQFLLSLIFFLIARTSFAADGPAAPPPGSANSLVPAAASTAPKTGPDENAASGPSFLEKYPHLQQNLYTEPNSNLYLGLSVGILGVLENRMIFSANFFQLHYITPYWDNEILSISYGTTTANPSYVQSNHFIFRTVPKIRLGKTFSIGPLFGYEYVSFPDITAELYNNGLNTYPEPFSSYGWIYGLGASENFDSDKSYKLKVTEVVYQETYSTQKAGRGWSYEYDMMSLNLNTAPIKAGTVFMIEVGYIF